MGATYEAGAPRIGHLNSKQKELIKIAHCVLANSLAESGFEWTWLQITLDSQSAVHTNSNDLCYCAIFLLGKFGGGAFHMADQSYILNEVGKSMILDGLK